MIKGSNSSTRTLNVRTISRPGLESLVLLFSNHGSQRLTLFLYVERNVFRVDNNDNNNKADLTNNIPRLI